MIASFNQDYDGDGNTEEGIYEELTTLRQVLLESLQAYTSERGEKLCYHPDHYPYFFTDTDGDGICSEDEADRENRFGNWTARMVKAAYNFQMAKKDPGAFAHNAKYIFQLLYDSIIDLNGGLQSPVDDSEMVRTDFGHFNGSSEAARHWDEDEEVSASCSRCHGGSDGYRFFTTYGVSLAVQETANGLDCATCHTGFGDAFGIINLTSTAFPHKSLELEGLDNICGNCHAGRVSGQDIDDRIALAAAGGRALGFMNVHYLPAAGTTYGSEVGLGYEYPGRHYAGRGTHQGGMRCVTCHDPVASNHTFKIDDVWQSRCDVCHGDEEGPHEIRMVHLDDYDGDGDDTEALSDEIQGLSELLLENLHEASGQPALCYEGHSYPYFFTDTDLSGSLCEPDEANYGNRFNDWTPIILQAAHNYQYSQKEPGAWAHNFDYMAQLLFDSIADLGGVTEPLVRP
jgi:hypothetical protein